MQDITESNSESLNYQERLNAILNKQLTLENIERFSDEALGELIDLLSSCVAKYKFTSEYLNSEIDNEAALEDSALKYFGLPNVQSILGKLIKIYEKISGIDKLVGEYTYMTSGVIVPTSSSDTEPVMNGDGEFEKAVILPKLKTLVFILVNNFGLDLTDTDQIKISAGLVTDSMMRRTSYNLVETPTINRTTLVCDESNNVTYVFNNEELPKDITPRDLANLTKPELDMLIATNSRAGKRIIYSSRFASKISSALSDDYSSDEQADSEITLADLILDKAPEGYLSVKGIADALNVGEATIKKAINSLGEALGEVKQYKFGPRTAIGYSPEQQEQIMQKLYSEGYLAPTAPEGYLSVWKIADALNVGEATIKKAINSLGEALGEVKQYKFYSVTAPGYSPEQQEQIILKLDSEGLLAPTAPEGYLTVWKIADALGMDQATIKKAINSLGEALGEVKQYKFYSVTAPGYSPEQQEQIILKLDSEGLLAPTAPEGYLSAGKIADALGVADKTIQKAIDSLGEALGEVKLYKFATVTALGYSPEQQLLIMQKLDSEGHLAPTAPEGYLAAGKIADALGVADKTIQKAIDSLGEALGEVKLYKFAARTAPGYSPEQQEQIMQELDRLGLLAPTAPEGYLAAKNIARYLGVAEATIKKTIDSLGEALGEVKLYKFANNTVPGYSPEQQEIIKQKLGKA